MGVIRKLKSGKYQADVRDAKGCRIRRNFMRKTDAQAFISMVEQDKYNSKLVGMKLVRKRKPILEAIEEAKQSKRGLRPRSIKKYDNIYHEFQLYVLHQGIEFADEFTPEEATKFRKALVNSNAAPKTINSYLMTVKGIFTDLTNHDYLDKNPFSHIKHIKGRAKSIHDKQDEYYTAEEVQSFFAVEMEVNYRDAFLGLYLTGMRYEEMASLTWEDLDLEQKLINIKSDEDFLAKTETSDRIIPMSDVLYKLLSGKPKNSKYVFPSVKGAKLSERTLLAVCKRKAKLAKIRKNATVHKFRHTFSSHLAQNSVSYEIRQYLMGHKPQSMTDRYTKIDYTKLHEHLLPLDEVIKGIIWN